MTGDLLSIAAEPAEKEKLGPVTAGTICRWMAETYSEANGYACLFEVSNGTGSSARRSADAVVMNLWPSRGMELVGYEMKVARSDWLHELKQPEKAWPVMKYCDRWNLIASPGVAKVEEVPANWGFIEYDGKKMRTRKAAPLLTPEPLARTFIASLLRRPVRDVEAMVKAAADRKVAELEAEFTRRVEQAVNRRVKAAEDVMAKVAEIKATTGIDLTSWTPQADVIAALKFAMTAEPFKAFRGYNSALSRVESAAKALQEMRAQLAPFLPQEPA